MLLPKYNVHAQIITVPINAVGRRVDNFLLSYLKGIPRDKVYRILRKGEIRVNKKRIKCLYRLSFGDVIRIPPIWGLVSEQEKIIALPTIMIKKLHTALIYEDSDLIILNKPSGIAVHGGSGLSFSIIDGLRTIRPELHFLELVHRLDRETSGALLIAKNYCTLMKLHEQLRLNKIKKEYLALVFGKCDFRVNIVVAPLLKRSFSLSSQSVIVDFAMGKYSKTCFIVQEKFVSSTLLKVHPITGRTHQIRVHAQYIGHPIVYDNRYGNIYLNHKVNFFGLNRLFLHAWKLRFIHPINKRMVYITVPIDAMLADYLLFLRKNEVIFRSK